MVRSNLPQFRLFLTADILTVRAALMKLAAGRKLGRQRDHTGNRKQPFVLFDG